MTNETKKVAAANEIRQFWTDILRDSESDMKDKLKVSELLARRFWECSEKIRRMRSERKF